MMIDDDSDLAAISMGGDEDVVKSTTTTTLNNTLEEKEDNSDIDSISMSPNIQEDDDVVETDLSNAAIQKQNTELVTKETTFQDTLYNQYSKDYPELFKNGKLEDVEGALEKGIISEYSYVPVGDDEPTIQPHSSTVFEDDRGLPVSYIYNKQIGRAHV